MNFLKNLWANICLFTKNCWQKINKPKGFWLVLFYMFFVCLISGTLTLVILGYTENVFSYILYGLSAISLTYFVYTIVYFAPTMKNNFVTFLKKFKFTSTLLDDYGYRTVVFSIFSFILNIAYISFVAVVSFISRSPWYFSITVYYIILVLMKGNVFYSKRKYDTPIKQARAYRFAGILFLTLTIAFSGIIVLIYKSNAYFEYAGLLIYVAAAYTFYNLTLSIINIFKARKHDNLYIQTIRNINLASAIFSVLTLQVAMFQAFSPKSNTSFANALTGAGVCAVIISLGILMIIKANKTLKELNISNEKQI